MKPAAFTYHRPASVTDAVALLARYGADAKPISGGQSLGPMMNMRIARPAHLVDLNDLLELDFIRTVHEGTEIGAMTRQARLEHAPELRRDLPLLSEAAGTIGHYAIRQRGTLGGSLVHADPAAQLPLIAVTLGAEVDLQSPRGERSVAAADFLRSIMTVDIAVDEVLTVVRFPRMDPTEGWAFDMVSRRHGDFAMASVAVTLRRDAGGRVTGMRFGVVGGEPVPRRLVSVEQSALGRSLDAEVIAALAHQAAEEIEPEHTSQVPAPYRRELISHLTQRSIAKAFNRAGKRQ